MRTISRIHSTDQILREAGQFKTLVPCLSLVDRLTLAQSSIHKPVDTQLPGLVSIVQRALVDSSTDQSLRDLFTRWSSNISKTGQSS